MKQVFTLFVMSMIGSIWLAGQSRNAMSDFRWTVDSEVLMKIEHDSTYTYDTRQLFHVDENAARNFNAEFIYYPVNLGDNYVDDIKNTRETTLDTTSSETPERVNTLWSSVHHRIGGGWVHFINCMLYALEKDYLHVTAPLMKRPDTKWKPDPPTDSYLRTRKWDYYVPVSQRRSHKEYEIRKKKGELGDLKNLPPTFIELFLETNNRQYRKMREAKEYHKLARIDMVKLLLGANYLGEAQITYISDRVLKAVKNYTASKIPSVLIFKEYDAAVAMEMEKDGYSIQKVAFREGTSVTEEEAEQRTKEIRKIVHRINEYNNQSFQKRLASYYGK